jgi:hypothetical protein
LIVFSISRGTLTFSENHLAGIAPDANIDLSQLVARSWTRTSRSTSELFARADRPYQIEHLPTLLAFEDAEWK